MAFGVDSFPDPPEPRARVEYMDTENGEYVKRVITPDMPEYYGEESMENALFVPSYKRAERLMRTINTLDWLSDAWRKKTYLVVRQNESEEYAEAVQAYGVNMLVIPSTMYEGKEFFGWGHTMDWIMDAAFHIGFERFAIMDDDLKLTYRPTLEEPKWEPMDAHFDDAMEHLLSVSPKIPYMGWRERQFSQNFKEEYVDNARFIHAFGFYAPFFMNNPQFRFEAIGLKHMTDLYMALNLMTHGVRTRSWCRFCHDDVPDAEGGCSTMRTADSYTDAAVKLRAAFPELINLYVKTNWGDNRVGTRISWKNAFGLYSPEGTY